MDAPTIAMKEPRFNKVKYEDFRSAAGDSPVLLMTAVPIEWRTVFNLLKSFPGEQSVLRCHYKEEPYYGGVLGNCRVVLRMCAMGASSRDGVLGACLDAIDGFKPCAVIMPGMAFGADSKKQQLGDVLVASQVIEYELNRVGEKVTVHRGAHNETGKTLLAIFRDAQLTWTEAVEGRKIHLDIGPLLSGDKLVDCESFKASLFAAFPKARGGEMEGHGLHAAAARRKVEWIVVKGIADWADGTKNKE